jgi:hypothetical protein
MLRPLIFTSILTSVSWASEFLLLCGAEEVFQIDPAADSTTALWTWRAKDRPELPESLQNTFRTTSECKPHKNGKQLLVTSSGGGCALLEFPLGKALWWARATNAHSIEALPGGLIAVASSVGKGGDQLLLYDEKTPMTAIAQIALPSAHGLVWDEARQCLWALGFDELIACTLENRKLVVKSRHKLPDDDGHDLRAVPHSPDLMISTHASVWRFHRDDATFRPDPDLENRINIKSADLHPQSARLVIIQSLEKQWWSDRIEFIRPKGKKTIIKATLYKARWLITKE